MISACCSSSCACATGSMCYDDNCPKTTLRPHNQNTCGGRQQPPDDTDKYRSTKGKDTAKKKNKHYVSLSHPTLSDHSGLLFIPSFRAGINGYYFLLQPTIL
ncbi:unnamed protein product [Ixodes pacificus]